MTNTDPGWYHADGDPQGTMRYWDGTQWVGQPTSQAMASGAPGQRTYGGAGIRLGARIIDAIIVGIPTLILVFAFIGSADDLTTGGSFSTVLLSLIIGAAYEIGFVANKGATPGKMILGLKVVNAADGSSPPGLGPAAMRWLPGLVGILPGIGSFLGLIVGIASGVMISSDDQNRSVQDRVGSTLVIKT